jgi:DNA invertase Pin-like site-specific DNA recombinase
MLGELAPGDVQFRPLAEPWADIGTSTGRLMLAVLGGLADVERDLIRTRTAEGRSRLRSEESTWGAPAQQKEATRRCAPGATLQELANSYDRSIFDRASRRPRHVT